MSKKEERIQRRIQKKKERIKKMEAKLFAIADAAKADAEARSKNPNALRNTLQDIGQVSAAAGELLYALAGGNIKDSLDQLQEFCDTLATLKDDNLGPEE